MKKLILILLKIYRRCLSPCNFGLRVCRFEPSCSKYAYQAIEKYGILRGVPMSLKRLARCHPFSEGGYDPVL